MAPDMQKVLDRYIVEDTIAKYSPGGQFEVKPGIYHISQLTGASCLMKVLVQRRQIMQDVAEGVTRRQAEFIRSELPLLRQAMRGTILHEAFGRIYREGLPGRVVREGVEVAHQVPSQLVPGHSFTLTGTCDIYDLSEDSVVEFKTVKHAGFTGWSTRSTTVPGVSHVPHEFHMLQGNAYGYLLGAKQYVVTYIDAEELVTKEWPRPVAAASFEPLVKSAEFLFHSETQGKVHPEILRASVEEWKCRSCPVSGECEVE